MLDLEESGKKLSQKYCYFWGSSSPEMFFRPERKLKGSTQPLHAMSCFITTRPESNIKNNANFHSRKLPLLKLSLKKVRNYRNSTQIQPKNARKCKKITAWRVPGSALSPAAEDHHRAIHHHGHIHHGLHRRVTVTGLEQQQPVEVALEAWGFSRQTTGSDGGYGILWDFTGFTHRKIVVLWDFMGFYGIYPPVSSNMECWNIRRI